MFGRKSKRTQKREAHQKALREGLIFWLPGGSSQINVYLDYCVIRCLGKTKMKEKEQGDPLHLHPGRDLYPCHRQPDGQPSAHHQGDARCEAELLVRL